MKYIRIVIKGEPRVWFDHPIPQGQTFVNIVSLVRAGGQFAAPTFYVPYESIHHMMEIELTELVEPSKQFMQ